MASTMAQGNEALLAAAASGDAAAIDRALAAGAPLHAQDPQGRTALLIAVAYDRTEAALRLIAAGADINLQAKNHDSAWLLAGALGRTAVIAAMLDTGRVDYSKRNRFGGNALIPACERGHVATVRLLLERSKIDVDHVNNLGWTALLEAVFLGDGGERHQEIIRLLLAHRANVNLADRDGVTPLAHARKHGYRAIAKILEEAGGR
jgi:ankyrin repeat protein